MVKSGNVSGPWRAVIEAVCGVVAAAPVGIWLYFVSILIWAEVVTVAAIPIASIPYVGPRVMNLLNFSPGMALLLMAGAVVVEVLVCRILIRRHYPVFAYTQAVLGLAASSPFFWWTAVHQKPLLPFWGQ